MSLWCLCDVFVMISLWWCLYGVCMMSLWCLCDDVSMMMSLRCLYDVFMIMSWWCLDDVFMVSLWLHTMKSVRLTLTVRCDQCSGLGTTKRRGVLLWSSPVPQLTQCLSRIRTTLSKNTTRTTTEYWTTWNSSSVAEIRRAWDLTMHPLPCTLVAPVPPEQTRRTPPPPPPRRRRYCQSHQCTVYYWCYHDYSCFLCHCFLTSFS